MNHPDLKILCLIAGGFLALAVLGFVGRNNQAPSQAVTLQPKQSDATTRSKKAVGRPGFENVIGRAGLAPVLMYHHVGELPVFSDSIRRDLTVAPADFSQQIALLDNLGYHSITTQQLYDALNGSSTLPDKPVVITFDDGYEDVFQNAVPILKQHNMIGTFAINPGFIDTVGRATWAELVNAQAQGMEIVCHSQDHMDFTSPKYTHEMKLAQVLDCKNSIQQHLGIDSKTFVYPYGHFNAEIENILKDNGFNIAFTTKFGIAAKNENLLAIPRVRVHGKQLLESYQKNLSSAGKYN